MSFSHKLTSALATAAVVTVLGSVLITAAPGGASARVSSVHLTTVARYRAGATLHDAMGRTWRSDAALRPGGRLVHKRAARYAQHSRLYRFTRLGAQRYRIPLPSAGRFRVVMRSLRCNPAPCSYIAPHVTVRAKRRSAMLVNTPMAVRKLGVSTVIVRRIGPAAPRSGVPSAPLTPSIVQPGDVVNASSFWRTNITHAPTAGNSAAQVADLVDQVKAYYGGNAAFNVTEYNPTWYTVGDAQATTTVGFTNCQKKNGVPPGLYGRGGQFVDVPIPDSAITSTGTDSNLTIYRPATDQLWDFWEMSHGSSGWSACWGGRIDHVSTSNGQFPGSFGASASGLASELGDVSITDAQSGSIDHAVTLAIPNAANWNDFSWPAQRSDGWSNDSNAIPEGTRLRLDPSLDVSALHLNPIATMIAKAAQKYGFIVTDRSGCVAVTAESGKPSLQKTGVNPWTKILNGTQPYEVMANFPWDKLATLPKNYGSPNS